MLDTAPTAHAPVTSKRSQRTAASAREEQLKNWALYAGGAVLSVVLAGVVMRLWEGNFSVPFSSTLSGDTLYYSAVVKGMIENGWYLHNDQLGMPAGQDLNDYPELDNVQYFLIKLISLVFHKYAVALNVYLLLGFPLITLSCLMVLRHFGISRLHSLLGSLIYAFLPYHFFRGLGHVLLASYWLVPPMAMVSLWVFERMPLFWKRRRDADEAERLFRRRTLIAAAICLLISTTGYYAFFGCFFLLVAGVTAAVRAWSPRPLWTGGTLIGLVCLGLLLNLTPLLSFQDQHGENPAAVLRNCGEPELYGLKIVQMLLPVTGHRLPALKQLKNEYNRSAPVVTENDSASLGVLGSLGLLVLIGWLFVGDLLRRRVQLHRQQRRLLGDLSLLTLAAILLSTVGGFSVLVSRFMTASIRGYNRISIFIAFFAVLALAILLDAIRARFGRSEQSRRHIALATPVLLVLAILDQTTEKFVPPYEGLADDWNTRASFMQMVESTLPAEAMVFQLPYVSFPVSAPVYSLQQYDHLAGGYLVSKTLRWSYGAMFGRDTDRWQATVAAEPVPKLVRDLVAAGFSAIYVDRFGYADRGASLEAGLVRELGIQPIVSADRRRAVYSLETFAKTRTAAGK
jgi:phosphoglycerol transferase